MTQLSWIGLGNMGRGMVKNLVEKGNLDKPIIIYNRTKKRADDLAAKLDQKVVVASTVEEAVQSSDVIFTCVGDDAAINDTIDTALKQNVKGKLFVDCSTVHPDTTDALGKRITEAGAEFVASPVFGAPAMADNGQLVCVLAGPKSSIERMKPYTENVIARANIEFPDQRYGHATLLKVIGNTFIVNMVETLAEGHTVAEKSGLGSANLHKFIETMFPGPYVAYSNRMQQGDYYKREEPLFAVDLARKDVGHALNLAKESGAKMRNLEAIEQHLVDVKEHQGEKGDIAGIYGAVRKESGLNFEV
ncbi:hypothetical protein EJ05DRAFT_471969 [Pseudovirgaria hyperparasitica]|uniref:6-phosphogluconate dehydrogenase 2 n=1 Tax=Pseudovirgaria hyperparasitica TaxID=470096 RepID=A0A6A6WLC7_9PEZI|nr:uncharacterized protein EJ05DRAFT_471969 [Pseudovirgaria hyperparasitica]KAF2763020.1 hypothetical protein EJ05DRAFT_471969 [Pseudovirgaria hyperparasitica]